MRTILIVEGPDGSGKTRLCRKLEEEFGLEYMRFDGLSSTKGPTPEIVDWWDQQIAENRQDAVYDRCFYVSEVIYQLATPRRPLMVEPAMMVDGIFRLWTFDPIFIFCLPPWEVTIANVGQRERLEGVDDKALEKIWWAYHSMYAMYSNALYETVTAWDYTDQNPALLKDWVADRIKEKTT